MHNTENLIEISSADKTLMGLLTTKRFSNKNKRKTEMSGLSSYQPVYAFAKKPIKHAVTLPN